MKKLLSFLALALCFVACQNDAVESVNNGDLANVVLTIDAPELGVTRADGDTLEDGTLKNGKNSAFGAIDFLSDADWANYDLRYILEVYKAGDEGTGEPIYRERLVNCLDKYAPTTFDLRLVPNRTYKFVVFADFVAEGSTEAEDKLAIADLYYNTADLRNISAITDQPTWNAMNEIRDAYFISKDIEVTTGLQETLTLTRPFAKLRVITTDIDYINGYSTPGYVEVTYKDEPIYKSFNAVNGLLNKSDEMKNSELTYGFEVNKNIPYTEGYDALVSHQTLFADYLFAVEGEQTAVNFEMKVYESKGGNLIHAQDFSTQIPIQRNYLTTIIGDLLTTQANITIKIDDNFIDEWVNPTMKVEPTVLATPAVKAEVKENVVTLTWEAVENAALYGITVGTEMPVFVEETTYVFTGEYETEYTFNVVAVPADEDKFAVSEAATVTATTEAAPVVEPFVPVASEWGVVGDLNGWNAPDVVMYTTETENLFVAENVTITSGSFKVRANNEWNDKKNYGLKTAGKVYADQYYAVETGGGSQNITPMTYGTYDVYFDLANERVALVTPGKSYADATDGGDPVVVVEGLKNHEWGLVGSFNGWDVANYVVTEVQGDWAVAKNVTLTNGAEFKFAADKAWTLSYGSACDVKVGETYTTYENGGNMKFVGEAGTYNIYFSLVNAKFYIE